MHMILDVQRGSQKILLRKLLSVEGYFSDVPEQPGACPKTVKWLSPCVPPQD